MTSAVMDRTSTTVGDLVPGFLEVGEHEGIVEFVCKHRVLSDRYASQPGLYSLALMPYQAEIMEMCEDPSINRVSIMAASQVGKTIVLENVAMFMCCTRPRPTMWCMPSEIVREDYVRDRLMVSIEESPRWAEELVEGKKPGTDTRIGFRKSVIYLPLATSRAQLLNKSIGFVIADEIDEYPTKTKKEGSALDQLKARMRTFPSGQFWESSTPTDPEGAIAKQYEKSDMRRWFVPCPSCGVYTTWKWSDVRWDARPESMKRVEFSRILGASPAMVWWECPSCRHRVHGPQAKLAMNQRGHWEKTGPASNHAGFHIPSLCSPFTTFHGLAADWQNAIAEKEGGDIAGVKHFRIHEEGLPFESPSKKVEVELVRDRISTMMRGFVPPDCTMVTVGGDVQEDCIYWTVWGWGKERRAHLIDHGVAVDFEEFAEQTIRREFPVSGKSGDGSVMRARGGLIDSGYRTGEVYEFCYRYQDFGIVPSKGQQWLDGKARWKASKAQVAPGKEIPLLHLDTTQLKDIFMTLIGRSKDVAGAMTFHMSMDESAARQLVSEHKVWETNKRGFRTQVYHVRPGYQDNHFLDCSVGALAAHEIAGGMAELLGRIGKDRDAERRAKGSAGGGLKRIERGKGW